MTGLGVAARIANARMICPTPGKTSFGSSGRGARGAAERLAAKTGRPWEAYGCVCGRCHIRVAKSAKVRP